MNVRRMLTQTNFLIQTLATGASSSRLVSKQRRRRTVLRHTLTRYLGFRNNRRRSQTTRKGVSSSNLSRDHERRITSAGVDITTSIKSLLEIEKIPAVIRRQNRKTRVIGNRSRPT